MSFTPLSPTPRVFSAAQSPPPAGRCSRCDHPKRQGSRLSYFTYAFLAYSTSAVPYCRTYRDASCSLGPCRTCGTKNPANSRGFDKQVIKYLQLYYLSILYVAIDSEAPKVSITFCMYLYCISNGLGFQSGGSLPSPTRGTAR